MSRRPGRVSAEEQMIRLSAGTAARRQAAQQQAVELGEAVNWPRLLDSLQTRRLLPTLGPRVVELTGDRASEEFRLGVAGALEATRRQAALVQLISARVQGMLAGAGIRSAPLKGPLLGEALYGEPGRRQSSDIDLLVAADQLPQAVEVVRGLGYAAPADRTGENGLPLLHFALVHERSELPPVELHWRIHWYESGFARDRLLPPAGAHAEWRAAPVDELVALLLYYARDGLVGLRHPTDLGAWWDAFGAGMGRGALDRALQGYRRLQPAAMAATRAAEAVVGLPASELTEQRLGARGRIAVRLANPLPHSGEAQVFADMGLIDGLLTPFGGWRAFVLRQVAPPRETLPTSPGAARPVSRLGHGARVLGRYALTMSRLLRPRQAVRSGSES